MWRTPAAPARATIASSSFAKSGKSRWQWLSTSMASDRLARFRLDIARKNRRGRRQLGSGRDAMRAAEMREVAFRRRNSEQIKQFLPRFMHERLRQDRDLPENLGRDV